MNKNNKILTIIYLFASIMILNFIICSVLFIFNIDDLTSFSYIEIRNITFYFIISLFYNLILLSLLAVIIMLLYNKYKISLLNKIIIVLPFFIVIVPHVLVWIAYSSIDSRMSVFGKVLFNMCICVVVMSLFIFLLKLTKFDQLKFNKTKIIKQILKISAAAYIGLLFLFFITLIATSHRYAENKASSPNIILIVVDALRKDFIGAYGSPLNIAPHIDYLAESGVIFENAFAGYPGSVPGHASILFGEEIEEHKAMDNNFTIVEKKESIARILKSQGYYTYGICQNPIISRQSGFSQGFDFYWSWGKKFISNAPIPCYFYILPINQIIFKVLGIDLINTYFKILVKRDKQPFFCFINYLYCHSPYHDYSKPRWITKERIKKVQDLYESSNLPNETDWPMEKVVKITADYAASVCYVDSLIGCLINDITKKDLIKDTLT